ncbi:hypothetical protein MXZ20_03875 [Streptococcus uberis]|uniref:sigma factor-like helix-turn-helix DNA-binding protein n=1 Tax=Streptococcus uberis TaxID=1349 RepID=UPI001FF6D3AE|nr:sigma factor-like helix-turn-helix DNA-binding protein [Streptococcus uberis]MCK1159685.1 hypothetical protein [Streptococcus uberis]MCK1161465.1 hypothetical protein [Streptococcus uberis]
MVVNNKLKRLKIIGELLQLQQATLKDIKSIASNMSDSRLLEDTERQIATEVEKLSRERSVILSEVANLKSDKQIEIIKLRYLNGYKWDRVAYVMGISINTVYKYHRQAIENLKK